MSVCHFVESKDPLSAPSYNMEDLTARVFPRCHRQSSHHVAVRVFSELLVWISACVALSESNHMIKL